MENITLVIDRNEAEIIKNALVAGRTNMRRQLEDSTKANEDKIAEDIITSHRLSEILSELLN